MTVCFLVEPFVYESQSILQTITSFLQFPGEADPINTVLQMLMKQEQGVSMSSLCSGNESVGKTGRTFDMHLECDALRRVRN